ncbi:MAG: transcriptional repressor [Spirochaetales bacterium]|nr:transcriptional repressor [Spirochaetales bacterium]MBP7263133.1 transcriptional repressor [Spirochaetia bacterium]
MTKARSRVLAALDNAAEPLSAAGVMEAIGQSCDQATVYRALAYLEGAGLAESFVFHCDEHGTERYYVKAAAAHRHWFHCRTCHRFVDLGSCVLDSILAGYEKEYGIRVKGHALYLTGDCADCAAKAGGA